MRRRTLSRTRRSVREPAVLRTVQLEDRIAPAQLLPDLQILPSYLSGWTVNNITGGREVRYSTALANGGQGAFETRGTSTYFTDPDGTQRQLVNQRIYNSDGTWTQQPAGYFVYHPTHGHIHFDDMAWGQLRIRGAGNTLGEVVAVGPKTSYCLYDLGGHFNPALPGSPPNPVYTTCNPVYQGISVGYNDVYSSSLAGQSINITGIPNGNYWLEVVADPLNHIQELDETNNTTRIAISLTTQPTYGFRVQNATPLAATTNPVSYADLNFNMAVNPATFATSDVTLAGPAGSISIDSIEQLSSLQYRVHFAEQTAVGTYTLTIGPNIANSSGGLMDQNNNGTGGETADRYINIFALTAPHVLSAAPAGTVSPPINSVRIFYDRPMNSSSFTLADIVSFTGPGGADLLSQVTGVVPVTAGGQSIGFDVAMNAQAAVGDYSLVVGPDISDANGNTVDQTGDGATDDSDRYTAGFFVNPPGIAGPDAFGYDAVATVAQSLELVGQSGVTNISFTNTDDGATSINLGTNSFNFYGTTYTGSNQLYVSTNGLITFGGGTTSYNNDDFILLTRPTIAVLWDDWAVGSSPQALWKMRDLNSDGTNDQLIVEWNQVIHTHGTSNGVTFQAVLGLNTGSTPGSILFNYQELNTGDGNSNGVSASVGLRGPGSNATRLVVSNSGTSSMVGNNTAILVGVPRVVSLTRENPSTVDAPSTVAYRLAFDHPVTEVDAADFMLTTTGTIAGAFISDIHATIDPAVFEVQVWTGTGSGTLQLRLADNDSIVSTLGAHLGGIGAGNGSYTGGEVYTTVQQPPGIQGFNIGDGTSQRSTLRQVQVVFDMPVTFVGAAAGAFELTGPNGAVAVNVDTSLSTSVQTVARLTFSGAGTEYGSLADGNYTLRVIASKVQTGGATMSADQSIGFFRYFGDYNGDRRVDISDFGILSATYLKLSTDAGYQACLDYNGDNRIDIADFGQFSIRYFTNLP